MNHGGAPKGNQNAAKGKRWQTALEAAMDRLEGKGSKGEVLKALDAIAERVVLQAMLGDKDSVLEIATRLDGKVAQRVEATGADGKDLFPAAVTFVAPEGL